MALLPSTAETRMVPVAGRQFAERRMIRGVGAAERAVGNAWGRMTSREREYYGSQKNFVGRLQRESNRRASKREEDDDNAQREQGRADALGNAPPPKSATAANQAASIVQKAIHSRRTRDYVAKQVEDDMYPEGKPSTFQVGPKPSESKPAPAPQTSPAPRPPRPRPGAAQGSESGWNHDLGLARHRRKVRNVIDEAKSAPPDSPNSVTKPARPAPGPATGNEAGWKSKLLGARRRQNDKEMEYNGYSRNKTGKWERSSLASLKAFYTRVVPDKILGRPEPKRVSETESRSWLY
jgi:hypothetical protein